LEATLAELTLFLCGDVMTGRGVDQVLPNPGNPQLHERHVASATRYVSLAEAVNGPIAAPVSFDYVWGDALTELDAARPDARIVNLETAITASDEFWPKGINYRMNPANVPCLTAAGIQCCCLANNHTLDYRHGGLADTTGSLRRAQIAFAGAGENAAEAGAPAILEVARGGRVIVFSFGSVTSGIPRTWAAGPRRPGVNLLRDLSPETAKQVAAQAAGYRQPGDIVVVSIHWGANWGYEISEEERSFAHDLIDSGMVDLVHGHSSHHPKGIEVHRGKLVLYGCGDFIDDYEGIAGYEPYRDDLVVMYLATIDSRTGGLHRLKLVPFQIRKFRLNRPTGADAAWMCGVLDRESSRFGAHVAMERSGAFEVSWR
jgi:poly-gamma-glutamate synthesis protein (capsule biosynthesis protein)